MGRDTAQVLTVTDGTSTYKLSGYSTISAFCASGSGTGQNKMFFPSTNLPTLIVNSGITMEAGTMSITGAVSSSGTTNIDLSGSDGTFKTTTGAVTIGNGAVGITGALTTS